jgi:hypothetical protein
MYSGSVEVLARRTKPRGYTPNILVTLASICLLACQNDGRPSAAAPVVPMGVPGEPITAWVIPSASAGAPAANEGPVCSGACGAAGSPSPGGSAGSDTASADRTPPAQDEPAGGSGATLDREATPTPPEVSEPSEEVDCVDFRAHGRSGASDETPFMVPAGENYHCFYFHGPWDKPIQGVRVDPLTGTKGVAHHLALYSVPTRHVDGSSEPCLGLGSDGTLIPAFGLESLPSDTGFAVPAGKGRSFLLELHYINTGEPIEDRTGVRLCTARTPRPRTATLTWLGTEQIELAPGRTGTATGSCTPLRAGAKADEPIELYMLSPHMHQLGRRNKTVIRRASGATETLLDAPFDYADPLAHSVQAKLEPGDSIGTTCTYDNSTSGTVLYGPSVYDEMCYTFALAYPAGALDNTSLSLVGAENTCFW